jgi:hypothetical protein
VSHLRAGGRGRRIGRSPLRLNAFSLLPSAVLEDRSTTRVLEPERRGSRGGPPYGSGDPGGREPESVYRRRRLVAGGVAAAVLLLLIVMIASAGGGDDEQTQPPADLGVPTTPDNLGQNRDRDRDRTDTSESDATPVTPVAPAPAEPVAPAPSGGAAPAPVAPGGTTGGGTQGVQPQAPPEGSSGGGAVAPE